MFRTKRISAFIALVAGATLTGTVAYAANGAIATSNSAVTTVPAATHAGEMSKGKSHEQAREATTAPVDTERVMMRAEKHAAEMSKGKSHEQAREAAAVPVDTERVMMRAKKHAAEMSKGKSHEQAREAAAGTEER